MRRASPTFLISLAAIAILSADAQSASRLARRPATAVAPAPTPGLERPHIVNGLFTSAHPTVGALLMPANPATGATSCSGTMIGCATFLTAAHCVCEDTGATCQAGGPNAPDPGSFIVFLQHAGFFLIESIAVHPSYNFPTADVAVLRLAQPVTGIRPTPINTLQKPPAGTTGTIAGFGRSGGGSFDYGLKRFGRVTTTASGCAADQICWSFESPLGPPGEDSNTCNADSGGPLFWDSPAGEVVAGITSGGLAANCDPYDLAFDADVFTYRTYIQAQGGADLGQTSCGPGPQVGDAQIALSSFQGSLSPGNPDDLWSFVVPAGTTALRVALNASEQSGADFDLYVKQGSPATVASFDCKADGPNQYGFCEHTNPATGSWYARVQRYSGSGPYQLTATAIGATCHPGNEGSPCDDGNPCTGNDSCQSSICIGAPVPDGTPCDDSAGCTTADRCEAGSCAGSEAPRGDCVAPVAPRASTLLLKRQSTGKRLLLWSWRRGGATSKSAFGDPVAHESYDLCLYDETAGGSSLVLAVDIPAGSGWQESSTGFDYTDTSGAAAGLRRIRLRASAVDGRSRIKLRAMGAALPIPTLPLAQDSTVTLQLVGANACWESRFSSATRNHAEQFRARSD